jgi:hypothetical protein
MEMEIMHPQFHGLRIMRQNYFPAPEPITKLTVDEDL